MGINKLCGHVMVVLSTIIVFSITLPSVDSSVFFRPAFSQINDISLSTNNPNQTESIPSVTNNATTGFENSTIVLTATLNYLHDRNVA
jgi:hypothetical protein